MIFWNFFWESWSPRSITPVDVKKSLIFIVIRICLISLYTQRSISIFVHILYVFHTLYTSLGIPFSMGRNNLFPFWMIKKIKKMWKLLVVPRNLVSMHEVVINCSPRNFKRINGKLSEYQPHSYLRLQHDRGFTTGFDRMQEMALLGPQNSLEINCIDFGCLEASGKKKPFIWI